MNLLSIKAVVFDTARSGFYSPQRKDFIWPKGIVARSCGKCSMDTVNPECTCGIYSSPNPEALIEYSTAKNSVFCLLNTYGWADIWTGPKDLPDTYVLRSWGAQIVGIIKDTNFRSLFYLSPQRDQSAMLGAEYYDIEILPWRHVQEAIRLTWTRNVIKNNIPLDPYKPVPEEFICTPEKYHEQ